MSEKRIGWNEGIDIPEDQDKPAEFYTFPKGTVVDFVIKEFARAVSSNNNPMAKLVLALSGDGKKAQCKEHVVLCESQIWKLKQFLVCIGQASADTKTLKPRWAEVEGSKGKVKVDIEEYQKDGEARTCNKVDKWLDPDIKREAPKKEEPKKEEKKFDF